MKKAVLLSLMALAFAACEKNSDDTLPGSGNNQNRVSGYQLGLQSPQFANKIQVSTIVEAWAMVTEVELEKEFNDVTTSEIDIEGNFKVDLLTGTSNPPIPTVQIPADTYTEFGIELGDDDSPFTSLYAAGSTQGVNFEIEVVGEIEFEIKDEVNGIQIDPNTIHNFVVWIDIPALLNNIDFSTAQPDGDGVVRINPSSNTPLYNQIVAQLNVEVELEDDD